MELVLYNTLTRKKEVFTPLCPDRVGMYVCGPTVYDFAHIGNARPVLVFDILYRLLKRHFQDVTYVRNITDVDDKINAAAAEGGESIGDLTQRTTVAFHEDMAALLALSPDEEPRATTHIPAMVAMIESLIEKGHAYVAEGHVLFEVNTMPAYGQLSRKKRDDLIAGARVEVAPYKKEPADFVLWKPSTPDLPGWDSPWGRGRPGWHIECSTMSGQSLGETFDLHGGGRDLVFPHHENELAQSTCAHDGKPFARFWVHNGFLTVNGEKMSKSIGNVLTVRELLKHAPGEVIRFAMLSTHYRQPLDWSDDTLTQAREKMDRLYTSLREVEGLSPATEEAPDEIESALLDDLNTPTALSNLVGFVTALNKAETADEKARIKGKLLAGGAALGLLQQSPEAWFRWRPAGATHLDETEIERQIALRNKAREAKDFQKADRIRDELAANGILLEDRAGKTIWRHAG
ncbi:MAG: cysteine--tRNA ligase [Alphaproteobacteria bacterium]|nr:cysteine--tRNA ligase [Alphaproteobacteria bacterium]